MLSRSETGHELANAPLSHRMTRSNTAPGWTRLAEGFIHILVALGLGVLTAGGVLVALIWFSMNLPNG